MSIDLKDMFLHSPMQDPEFMKVPIKYFPQDICNRYNLLSKVHKGYIYIRIKKGMYGLKQGALLAFETLETLLLDAGYVPILGSTGMWKHSTRPTIFLFMCRRLWC